MQRLSVPAIWDGMTSVMTADVARLFFVVAPFTLLVGVAVDLFGPPPPVDLASISNDQLIWRLAVPSLIGAIGQLAATHLALRPDLIPRDSLGAALALFPAYVLAQLIAAVPVGTGLLLLVLPGLWLFARLSFLSGAVAMAEGGSALAILRRSWALSDG